MPDLAGYKLTFSDEFSSLHVSQGGSKSDWADIRPQWRIGPNTDIGFGNSAFVDAGSGINPFSTQNGALTITAVRAPHDIAGPGDWASGLLHSASMFTQTYGYFEIRAQVPSGAGVWPAFWLLRADGVWPPEIDVLESYGGTNVHQVLHTGETGTWSSNETITNRPEMTSGFHTYGVDWQADTITFYFDGYATAQRATPADMRGPMYMLVDLATQDRPGMTDAPKSFVVDYVRAFSKSSDASAVDLGTVSSPDGAGANLYGAATRSALPQAAQAAQAGAVSALTNGSFEATAAAGDPPYAELSVGSTVLGGWRVTAGSVDLISGFWQAADGKRSLDMNGSSAGTIEQSFATVVGQTYEVHFSLSGNPSDPYGTQHHLRVAAAGQAADFSFDSAGRSVSNMGWQEKTFTFTATSTVSAVTFSGHDGGGYGAALDKISVVGQGTASAPAAVQTPAPAAVQTPAPAAVQTPAPAPVQTPAPAVVQAPAPAAVQTPASAGSLVDGGFEVGSSAGSPPYKELNVGSPLIGGWAVVGGSVDLISGYWKAAEGSRSLDMNGSSAGIIEQSFATVAGRTYEAHFSLAGNPDDPYTEIHHLAVQAAGQSATYSFDSTGHTASNMGWRSETFTFKAVSDTTAVRFAGLDGGPYGAALDNVSVVSAGSPASPAPASSPPAAPAPVTPAPVSSPPPDGGQTAPVVTPTPSTAASPVLLNGGFETAQHNASAPFTNIRAGSDAIEHWKVVSGDVDLISGLWAAADGRNSIDMSGDDVGAIEQQIQTQIGQRYEVHFSLGGNPYNTAHGDYGLAVSAAGQSANFHAAPGRTFTDPGWTDDVFAFTAVSDTTALRFTSLDHGPWGAVLDNVHVSLASAYDHII